MMELIKKGFIAFFGMFMGNDGYFSSTKIISFAGFLAFLIVSGVVLYTSPDKFNYELFASLSAGSAASMRVLDKWINVKNNETKKED